MTSSLAHGAFLPTPLSSLVDREHELAMVMTFLRRPQVHLLTVTGPGGSGKTRLAIAVASQIAPEFPDGVVFVDLGPIGDPALVAPTIARAVGLRDLGREPIEERLFRALADLHLLLVLDNFEQVVTAAPLLSELLRHGPDLKLLVTSRVRLRLSAEQEFPLGPLPLPEASAVGEPPSEIEIAAVRLFIERAHAVRPDLALDPRSLADIAEIVHRLDGLPLAIELAAVRLRALSPAALLARLESRLPLLTGGPRDVPARQQTMRNAIAWSYDLLTPDEQTLFRRLAVFAGGFTMDAAQSVCGSDEASLFVLNGITTLIDHSLLGLVAGSRYQLLETVREYAWEQLEASGEMADVRRRHATYCLALAEQADRAMLTEEELAWLSRTDREIDNLRLAHEWAITQGNCETEWRFVAALWYFWVHRGALREGRAWSTAALTRRCDANPLLRARFFEGAGLLDIYAGDDARAAVNLAESVVAAKATGDAAMAARMLGSLGIVTYAQGDAVRARAIVTEMLSLARAADSRRMIGEAFFFLAMFTVGPYGSPRDWPRLRTELHEGVTCLRETGFHRGLAITLACQARLLSEVDAPVAAVTLREALELARGMDDPLAIGLVPWLALVMLAPRIPADQLALMSGGITTLVGRSAALGGRSLIELFGSPTDHASLTQAVAAARATLDEAAFAAAQAAGSALTFEELVEDLLAVLATGKTLAPPSLGGHQSRQLDAVARLTAREIEVLQLVAEGLTDRQIAERLSLSPKTVSSHLVSIFGKLGVSSRVSAARFAIDHGLA